MTGLMRHDLYAELYQVENSHWWHQHKRAMVKQLISKIKPGRVLDVGCGTGKILAELKKQGWQVWGVDAEPAAAKECQKRDIKIKIADATIRMPFKDNFFNAILALDFLEHVNDDKTVIRGIKRVLKPNGIIIISVPAYPKLYSYWDKMLGHYRRYSKSDLTQLMIKSGLKIKFISYYFSWLLLPSIMIRIIKKILNIKTVSDFKTNTDNFLILNIIKLLSRTELWLLKYTKMPFGLSLICVATPNNSQS